MHKSIEDIIKHAALLRFGESKDRISKCIGMLNENQLLYRPNDSSNSVANIIAHLKGNITQYIISGIGGHPDFRYRDEEFIPKNGVDKILLGSEIASTFEDASNVIKAMDYVQWTKLYLLQGFEMTGIDSVLHVIEHTSYHAGQITYITKMLTDQQTNYYEGKDLNIHNA